ARPEDHACRSKLNLLLARFSGFGSHLPSESASRGTPDPLLRDSRDARPEKFGFLTGTTLAQDDKRERVPSQTPFNRAFWSHTLYSCFKHFGRTPYTPALK